MLRSSGLKLSMGSTNTAGSSGARPHAGGDATRRSGSSLAQLESVLQRLNKHDERTQLQRVERTSVETQQKLLKDELLKAQEELALAHSGKNKLCEEIGALQQVKQDQQTQIEHLLVELRASRESQAVMAKKVDALERGSQDLKRNYIQSTTFRVKTASELLSRLHVTEAFVNTPDLSKAISSKCESWVGSEPNKRKRVEDTPQRVEDIPQQTIVDDCFIEDDQAEQCAPEAEKLLSPRGGGENREATENVCEPMDTTPGAVTSPETPHECREEHKSTKKCDSCIQLALENTALKDTSQKEVEALKQALHGLQAKQSDLTKSHEQAQARMAALSNLLEEKDGTIDGLNEALEAEKEKVIQAETMIKKSAEAPAAVADNDASGRVKVLEENLAQLNTYADHLEMLISQCASCSVKLQSENTQASEQ